MKDLTGPTGLARPDLALDLPGSQVQVQDPGPGRWRGTGSQGTPRPPAHCSTAPGTGWEETVRHHHLHTAVLLLQQSRLIFDSCATDISMLELPQFNYLGIGVVEKVVQGQVGIPVGTLPSLAAAGHHRCAGRGLAGAGRGSGARGRQVGRGPGSQRVGRGRGAPDTTPPPSSHISPNHSKPETADSQLKMLQNCWSTVCVYFFSLALFKAVALAQ